MHMYVFRLSYLHCVCRLLGLSLYVEVLIFRLCLLFIILSVFYLECACVCKLYTYRLSLYLDMSVLRHTCTSRLCLD